MGCSLFKRLAEAHPSAVTRLRLQYRMAADIMAVCNELIYGQQLRCGSQQIAQATLVISCTSLLTPPRTADDAWEEALEWERSGRAREVDSPSASRGLGRISQWLHHALKVAACILVALPCWTQ